MTRLVFLFVSLGMVWGQSRPPLVLVLIGPPASGKSTQTELLVKRYPMPVISDVELRKEGRDEAGMIRALERRLTEEHQRRGLVLDGYPETRKQAEALNRLLESKGLPRPVIVQIDVRDEVARERAKKQGLDPKQFEALLSQYKFQLATAQATYPEADIWKINGEKPPEEVQQTIRSLIAERLQ
jgi:adenylate kinase